MIDLVMVTAPKPPGSSTLISPAGGGLGDRAGKGLARRRAAARVDVIADAGDPGTSCLRVSRHG